MLPFTSSSKRMPWLDVFRHYTQTPQLMPRNIIQRRSLRSRNNDSNDSDQAPLSTLNCALPPPPFLHGKAPTKYWNAHALAFLGDAVWELYIRRTYFHPPKNMRSYHTHVKDSVRAEFQEAMYDTLIAGDLLTDEERDILRWGRNATGTMPNRSISRDSYRAATAIECLAGYLYLTRPARFYDIMNHLGFE